MLIKDLNDIAVKNGTSIKRMRNSINRVIDLSTPELTESGKRWYKSAYDQCADIAINSSYTVNQVAAAVSHLSPRQHWKNNIAYAKELIQTGSAPVMSRSLGNAKLALQSNNPIDTFSAGSHKTRSFYLNITNDYEPVTVDSWAARIAIGSNDAEKILNRKGMYQAISHAYKLAGNDHGLSPAETQAVAWCVMRGSHE